MERREFINHLGFGAGLIFIPEHSLFNGRLLDFEISLAEFSLASELWSGNLTNLHFPAKAAQLGFKAVEYVSSFFNEEHKNKEYLKDLKQRTDDLGLVNNLIMVDADNLADLSKAKRDAAVDTHKYWVDAAHYLSCRSIRVNLGTFGKMDEPKAMAEAGADGYGRLVIYGAQAGMDVVVENHFGWSSDASWLVGVMKMVNHPRAGTLPDFGNFCIVRTLPPTNDIAGYFQTECIQEYDRYKGIRELLPFAKGLSAKSHLFDTEGNEVEIDYWKIFADVKKARFKGYVGVEYEGGLYRMVKNDSKYKTNEEGILATKNLLEKIKTKL